MLLLFSCGANENPHQRQEATCGGLPACSSQLEPISCLGERTWEGHPGVRPFLRQPALFSKPFMCAHVFSFLQGWLGEMTAGQVVIFMQPSKDCLLLLPFAAGEFIFPVHLLRLGASLPVPPSALSLTLVLSDILVEVSWWECGYLIMVLSNDRLLSKGFL